ncbi:phosphotransferase [Thalassobacillus sp. CUG 92003]|uniref:phosphotransferase n=1 Tax=Thalassobacillus sp. CUG 92003 TaxID=2736641 RepID=UPI0021043620|nr:phosphotransferase [Thalassobacillus sp. CUG 92003]
MKTTSEVKGDSFRDRLFDWLRREHDLPVEQIQPIKDNIYQVTINGRPLLLKGYRRRSILDQQVRFFKLYRQPYLLAAKPKPFKAQTYILSGLDYHWGLFEWVDGRHLNFRINDERQSAVKLLKKFHQTSKGIDFIALPKDPLYLKWRHRLDQFNSQKDVFTDHHKRPLFDEISSIAEARLEQFQQHDWARKEDAAWHDKTWLHGDVAHHNFLLHPSNEEVTLIDFDLLQNGPHLYDHIQLAHRFLPYMAHDRASLFKHFKHIEDWQPWLDGVMVPTDLLREWLYGYKKTRNSSAKLNRHMEKLEVAWEQRKHFVRYAQNML